MKDAGCDPIGSDTDQAHEDSETKAGMTAAVFCGMTTLQLTQSSVVYV